MKFEGGSFKQKISDFFIGNLSGSGPGIRRFVQRKGFWILKSKKYATITPKKEDATVKRGKK